MNGVNVANTAASFIASVERAKGPQMNRAIAIALNRTGAGVRSEAVRRIDAEYNIRKAEINRAFTIRKAWAGNLRVLVYASGRPLNVGGFAGARQTKRGITVAIKKGRRRLIPGAFFMRIPNNNYRGVFERKFLSGRSGKRWGRFPVRAVTTVDVPGLFRKEIVTESLAAVAIERFRRELAASVNAIVNLGK